MSRIRLKYVDQFVDRHGTARFYFRRPGGARTSLPGLPGSEEFMAAYHAAMAQEPAPPTTKKGGADGTIDRLISDYFASPDYLALKVQTRRAYRLVIERWVRDEKIGHRPVRGLRRDHIQKMMAKRNETPGAANDLLKKIRLLMHFAIDAKMRTDDPTLRLKRFASGEFHTWTDDEIATFEARWPVGSRERTAFALLLYTGQRRSDVVKMSWRDVDGGIIRVIQQKTGVRVWIPLHPALLSALAASARDHIAILTTAYGKPFSTAGFGNWMAATIGEAKLPDECVTHGLRKAAARRLAEAGCSANEIASITGHKTLAEVERYTKEADRMRLAKAAIERLTERDANKRSQT
ncbi:MAG: tyrosine-type recombinase/integrase [Pseudomonadota bacterium]